jgi:hypothetical protein
MPDNNQNIALLRQEVERSANHRVKTSTDFAVLAGMIQERVRDTVATSTLKRIWGYVDGYASTRESTLDILARFIGFPDYETFVSDFCEVDGVQSSHRVMSESFYADDLREGDCLEVTWNPNRQCVFRYLGNHDFEVTESQNAKLKPGARFSCDRFTLHEPLFVHIPEPDGENALFVMGKKGGLTKIAIINC